MPRTSIHGALTGSLVFSLLTLSWFAAQGKIPVSRSAGSITHSPAEFQLKTISIVIFVGGKNIFDFPLFIYFHIFRWLLNIVSQLEEEAVSNMFPLIYGLVLFTCQGWLSLASPAKYDQRQEGDINVQIDVKDVKIIALLKSDIFDDYTVNFILQF